MSTSLPKVVLQPVKERSLKLKHPWVFSGAIKKVDPGVQEGDLVAVYSHGNEYLGTGHYHEGSIKVRMITFGDFTGGLDFWLEKFKQAYALRERLGLINSTSTTAYRLIHGEGDGFPGLIVDVYGKAAVLQAHTLGMYKNIELFKDCLTALYSNQLEVIYDKSLESLGKQLPVGSANQFLMGNTPEMLMHENGIGFQVNFVEGQKTGFFLDQRDNRSLLRSYSAGKDVLNTFCYSGGFSLAALAGGATTVVSIDSSSKATALAQRNSDLNGFKGHEIVTEDVFDYLRNDSQQYELVILDPPAFAKHLSAVDKAMIGYRNLNTQGFKKVKSGGLLFTFSCSQVIDKQTFRKVVFQAAAQSGRNVRILHQLSQGADHPISIYHPEGEYLKGLVLYVD